MSDLLWVVVDVKMAPFGTLSTDYLLHLISILYSFLLCPQLACKLNILTH